MPAILWLISGACFAAYFYLRGITQSLDRLSDADYFELPMQEIQKGDLLWLGHNNIGKVTKSLSYFEGLHRIEWRIVRGPNLGERGKGMLPKETLFKIARKLK